MGLFADSEKRHEPTITARPQIVPGSGAPNTLHPWTDVRTRIRIVRY